MGRTVDIILPTFNRRDCLATAVGCIRAQTFADWRLIVINDGGEDVGDLVGSFGDGRIEYHDRPHCGKAAQLNFALGLADAKYIAYMDDDDEVYPDHLERLVRAAEALSADFVYSDTEFTILDRSGRVFRQKVENDADVTPGRLRYRNCINHKQVLHAKALSDRVGRYDEDLRIYIDFDYIKRLMTAAERPFHVRAVTGNHILRRTDDVGSYASISGLWKTDPEAVGRSLLRFFEKDPIALERAYRALLDSDRRMRALQARSLRGRLVRLMRRMGLMPPPAGERISDAMPVDGPWRDAPDGRDLRRFFVQADETHPAVAAVNALERREAAAGDRRLFLDRRALPPSVAEPRFSVTPSGDGFRFVRSGGAAQRWVMLTSARPLPEAFSLEFTYVPYAVFKEQLQLDFQMGSFGDRLRFMVRRNRRLEFNIVENGCFIRKPVRSVPFAFEIGRPARIRLWSRDGVHALSVDGRCLMSFVCRPGLGRPGGHVAVICYETEAAPPIDFELRDLKVGVPA